MAKSENLILQINLSFELKCLEVLIKSYDASKVQKKAQKDWEEKTFSSHLVSLMKECEVALKYKLTITKEEELEDEAIDNGLRSANEANPIDIRFHQIWTDERLDYIVEAKNISLSQWIKSNGSKVNASQQQTEYITKGIDRFITGHFKSKRGCMLGYVVNGDLENILEKINNSLVIKNRSGEIIIEDLLTKLNCTVFNSCHNNKKLKHLFLIYSN